MATSLATAEVVDAGAPASGSFAVHAALALDCGGGAVEFTSGWEEHIEFGVRVDGDGVVSVNGVSIGSVGGSDNVLIDVVAQDGYVTVSVMRAQCGTVLCSISGVPAPCASERVRASAAAVELLAVE